MTQVALLGEVLSSVGRSLMTGTSRVCITATTMPAKASTGTIAPRRSAGVAAGRSVVVCVIAGGLQADPGRGTWVMNPCAWATFRCFGVLTNL